MQRNVILPLIAGLACTGLSGVAVAQQASSGSDAAKPEVIVTAVPLKESVMPTTMTSSSIYGIDLNIMDTPRSSTMLTHAQLDALSIQSTHDFSYLTSSSYTDAAFGVPNVPRIRGQTGDVFINGMRNSFTANAYGAPLSFNGVDTIDIINGPASVQAGPGQGVGGSINFTTKLPSADKFEGTATAEFDTLSHRRWGLDLGGPVEGTTLSYRVSYSGEKSDSFYKDQYFDQQALYAVFVAHPSDAYTLQFNTEAVYQNYRENDGVNRVNQALINNGTYLTGGAVGGIQSSGGQFLLGNPVTLGQRVNIDETPGNSAHALQYNAQLIQTYQVNDNVTLTNNTFFNYLNRDNQVLYGFFDSTNDTWTLENKTDATVKFATPMGADSGFTFDHTVNAGFSFRYAHVENLQGFNNQPTGLFDLTQSPSTWIFPTALQIPNGAFPSLSAFGRTQYPSPGRGSGGGTTISDTTDLALFLEHRIEITPQVSMLYGLRGDLVQAEEVDPIGGPIYYGVPDRHSTAWYGLANGNISPVYRFASWGSAYATANYAQYSNPIANDGGFGITTPSNADRAQLQQTTRLYELGMKFNLLDKTLFFTTDIFNQTRSISTGQGGTSSSFARINGVEASLNYQPERHFFATASYSFVRTRLDTAASFRNYPAEVGNNIDGAGLEAQFLPGQRFDDPGQPQHLFNFLTNYRLDSGLGMQFGVQVTGPIQTSTSGYLDIPATQANCVAYGFPMACVPASVIAKGGYYKSPVIPWQYTMNASVYYDFDNYQIKFSAYNLTDQRNLIPDLPYYGNDFLTRATPASADITLKVKF